MRNSRLVCTLVVVIIFSLVSSFVVPIIGMIVSENFPGFCFSSEFYN